MFSVPDWHPHRQHLPLDDDDLLIYYSDKYIYVNIIHTNKYVLKIHYTQPNKASQNVVPKLQVSWNFINMMFTVLNPSC